MAIGLTEWFKNETRRIYGLLFTENAAGPASERERLLHFLRRQGGQATVREVQSGLRFLKAPGKAEAALEELVAEGLGYWVDKSDGKRGRAKKLFQLAV